jgi:hypothetical protein
MAIQSNKEYLTKTLSRFNLTEDDIDLILAEHPGLEEANFNVSMCKCYIQINVGNLARC